MSGSYPSPFYTDPGFGRGMSNLAQVFAPNPGRVADRARAELYGAQTDEVMQRTAGQRALSERYAAGLGDDPAAGWRQIFAAGSQAGPQALTALREGAGVFAATQGVPESDLGRIVVGNGGRWVNTEGGTRYVTGVESGDRRYAAGASAGATIQSARIRADADRYNTDQTQAGADRRLAPEINPGNVLVVPPTSPLASRADPQGRIQGNASLPVEQGEAGRALRTNPNMPQPEQDANRGILPGAPAAEIRNERPGVAGPNARPAAPAPVNTAAMRAIAEQIDSQSRDAEGTVALAPEARAWVNRRASELYQNGDGTRQNPVESVAQAMAEFMQASPQRTDSSINPFSARTLGLPEALRSGTAAGSGAARSVQPPAQAGGAAPAAVPPPNQRVRDQVYPTPLGPMIWTGTGWRPAS